MKRRTKSDKVRCIIGKVEILMDETPLLAIESEEISTETDDDDVSKKIARGKKEEENLKRLGEHLNNPVKIQAFLPMDEKRLDRLEKRKIKFIKPTAEAINAFNKGKTIEGIKSLRRVFIHKGSILIETSKMILKLKKGVSFSDIEAEFLDKGLKLDHKLSFGKNLFSMRVIGNADPYLLSLELTADPRVEFLEPDFLVEGKERFSPLGNPHYVRQWHLNNVGLPNPNNPNGNHPTDVNPNGGVHAKIGADANLEAAWDNAVVAPDGGLGIKVAILEGGFDTTHPDLAASIDAVGATTGGAAAFSIDGNDNIVFLRGAANIVDDVGYSHGDVCAGMAIERNNGAGGVGSAFDARFIPVTTAGLLFTTELYARCLVYIAHPGAEPLNAGGTLADGADVLSISMTPSMSFRPSIIEEAMKYAVQAGRMGKGLVIVTAVPNDFIHSSDQSSVSGHDESIDVGDIGPDDRYIGSAYGQNGTDLDVSNYGFQVFSTHIVNPAGGYVNSYPDYSTSIDDPAEPVGYAINQVGTSFAAPLTAGIVALLLSRQPSLSWREVKEIVRTTAFPVNAGHNGRLASYYNENGNPTYLGWKTADVGGLDIVDASGHLILTGAATNLSAAVVAGVDGVVHGTFDLPVASSAGFAEGQAILIGVQTTLTAAPTLIGAQSLPVASLTGFAAGQTIRVGSGVFTHLVLGVFVGDDELVVTDPSGFVVGDSIQIRKEVPGTTHAAIITQIKNTGGSGKHPFIKIDTPITALFGACGQGDRVELAETREVKILAPDVPNSKLLIDPLTPLVDPNNVYTNGTRVEIKSSEVRVIKAIDAAGPNTLRIDTLLFDHPIAAPVPVLGGRTPRYSRAYGFGRVDAAEAVDASRNYTHHLDHADMMIRDELADTGLLDTVNPVDSPDVWVRNIHPVIDGGNAFPANYNTAGPHQDALADEDRYVYVRLKNIGALPNFDFKVRIYVALVGTGTNPDLNFPVDVADPTLDWAARPDDAREIEDIRDGAKGLYLLEEKSFTAGDVPANTDTTFHVEWQRKDVPPADSLLDSYLLVQITPFDGIKSNIEVKRNNNLTYKKIAIEERIKFRKYPTGEMLEELLQVGNLNPPVTVPFYIEIDEVQGTPFPTNKIEITVTRRVKNGPNDSLKFHFNAGNWEFEGGVTPDWIFFEDPRGISPTDPTPAAANTTLAYFVGHFDTSLTQKQIKFEVEVFDAANDPFFDDEHRIKFKFDVEEGSGFSNEKGAKFHFFTDTAALQLQLDQASGGKPFGSFTSGVNDKFRVTSLHIATATAKAYAVCDGIVCCQDSTTPGLINLILKPTKQPAISFAPIKYIIYKGIQKVSLIDGVKIAVQGTNKLTDHLWVTQQKTDASINSKRADMGLTALPAQDAPAKALGVHLTALLDPAYTDNQPIDNLFFRNDPDIQFPLVRGGWDIGEFNQPEFGIEIIFDSLEYSPKIEAARIIDHVLSFPQLPASPTRKDIFEGDALREEMLNYMDPCAFFGSFFESKLYVRSAAGTLVDTNDFDKKKGHDIYDTAIKKFANKNKVYVDIRNEYKHHLNFFDNYNDAIELSLSDQPFVDRIYKTQGWPILILDNSEFKSNNSGKKDTISIGFPTSKLEDIGTNVIENRLPMVYISQGYKNQFLFPFKELKGKKKFVELETDIATSGNLNFAMTKDQLELAVSNDNDEAGTTIVSSYIRLIYVKRRDPAQPVPVSSGTVIRGANPLDNHFRPLRLKIPFNSAITFSNRSVVYDEEAYVDGLNSQAIEMDFIGKIGFSEDSQNVSLFTYAYDIHDKDKIKSNRPFTLVGENGNEDSAIKEISNKHDNIEVVKQNFTIASSPVPYIILNDISTGFAGFDKVDPREFQGVILTLTQFDAIIAIAEDPLNFDSQKFPVYLGFKQAAGDPLPQQVDDNGNQFTRYELCLRGFLLVGSDYQVNEVLTTIIIYSNGAI